MLDTDTRRRIDAARDILVGKVPDPKSQVEQITIALIYKFMDDIDAQSEEMGGRRSFFAEEFERFRWANLVQPGIGGHETLSLYAEAITRMPENPGVPPLFRGIFRNAYLPYRDPETLRAFLKEIDRFSYDDSERLGDAFEYLLSVLGAQGDAGQFRTPRHIIDFIVAVLDPKKNERVLDPACGTAGFLISAYKHILAANADEQGASSLTPDDRGRLADNFTGYDISPDMVRLSLVNMYLHGFKSPDIREYDTLTSEEYWDRHADVILANPPFMSPKGGIRPHKRFSVQSKRSEVLFVDYMAEHLTSSGRAGIIVPEGVIFQGQTAHTQLRKVLVEGYLVAVVSLPAGVFQPYSGVKTSILILDRALARRTNAVAFFKVERDGFDLGAQRRPVEANDLPRVQAEIAEYLRRLRAGASLEGYAPTLGLVVERSRVAEGGHYSLSVERYREGRSHMSEWPTVRIDDVCEINPRKSEIANIGDSSLVSFLPMAAIAENAMYLNPAAVRRLSEVDSNSYTYFRDGDVLVAKVTPCFENGKAGIARGLENGIGFATSEVYVLRPMEVVLSEFLYLAVGASRFRTWATPQMTGTGGLQRVPKTVIASYEIPLPPLDVQHEIVTEIDGYQRVIDGARAVLVGYRPHVAVDPSWPLRRLKQIASVGSGFGFPLQYQGEVDEEIPFLKVSDMNLSGNEVIIRTWNHTVSRGTVQELKAQIFPAGTVIFPKIGAAIATNKKRILSRESTYDNNVMGITPNTSEILPEYLYASLLEFNLSTWASEAQPPSMRKGTVEEHEVPLPPLDVQQAIVAELEAERALVEANRELINRMESRIASAVGRVWGE